MRLPLLTLTLVALTCWLAIHVSVAAPHAGGPAAAAPDLGADWERMRRNVPPGYVCTRAGGPVLIDGKPDEPAWATAAWTDDFVDIEGDRRPKPRFRTRAKMVWDDDALYVAAVLEEPHVWGTITKRNAVMFADNDFEVFIDPDGDNHNYYEFEMNALNTPWQLSLVKPYRDGGPALDPTELEGLRTAVRVDGTMNQPGDTDKSWSIEIAIPWKALKPFAERQACSPRDGDQWRMNFSRVEWLVDIIDGKYRKIPKEMRPEDNWVWSPTGFVDIHRPERWGYVQFSSSPKTSEFRPDPTLPARDALMNVYHRQHAFKEQHGRYATSTEELGIAVNAAPTVEMKAASDGYTATASPADGSSRKVHVRQDSKLWAE
jgi:hypothetical protein